MLELLVVLFVVGGLWALAYPQVRGMHDRPRILPSTTLDTAVDTPIGANTLLTGPVADESLTIRPRQDRCYLVRVGATASTTASVPCPPVDPTAAAGAPGAP